MVRVKYIKVGFVSKLYRKLNEPIVDRYGLGKVIRAYGFYPQFFPITITGEHGPSPLSTLILEALERRSPYYYFSSKRKEQLDFKNKRPVRHPSPFVWYRRKKKISRNQMAIGSVFFLAHSTSLIKTHFDFDLLFEKLDELSKEFLPIQFCLHFNDVKEELTRVIESKGYRWFCLAENFNENQLENFYKIIPGFKYAIGNKYTSGFLYCTEMGIPCSLLCSEVTNYINHGNPQLDFGEFKFPEEQRITELFNGIRQEVTSEQILFMEEELGLDLIDSFSNRLKISYTLYVSLLYCSFHLFAKKMRTLMKSGIL